MPEPLLLNHAIAQYLDVIGDRWALLILRDAFLGCRQFEQFRQRTGANRATLSRRLEALVDSGVLERHPVGTNSRTEYQLSEDGQALYGAALLAWDWERRWPEPDSPLPKGLTHSSCGAPLAPSARCGECHQALSWEEVRWPAMSHRLSEQFGVMQSLPGRRRGRAGQSTRQGAMANISELIGDRWTLTVLIAAFLGLSRFDEWQQHLGIAPNILTERLARLHQVGIFTREPYQQNPPRDDYKLADKGKQLFPLIMFLHQWACTRVAPALPAPLTHTRCGQPLRIEVVCPQCGEVPDPQHVI